MLAPLNLHLIFNRGAAYLTGMHYGRSGRNIILLIFFSLARRDRRDYFFCFRQRRNKNIVFLSFSVHSVRSARNQFFKSFSLPVNPEKQNIVLLCALCETPKAKDSDTMKRTSAFQLIFIVTVLSLPFVMASNALAATASLGAIDSSGYRWLDAADQAYSATYQSSYDYTQASIEVVYDALGNSLHGTLTATNLKPNFAYQLKLAGYPGTDANERIGLAGRWWQEEWNGTNWANGQNLNNKGDGSSPSPNDNTYFARRDIPDATSPTGLLYRYTGYLVFDYFITDENGDATLSFTANSSYHVLWKTTQRTPTASDGPIKTSTFDPDPTFSPAYDMDYGANTIGIFGEWERLPVGGVFLQPGDYTADIILTEESFHGSGGTLAGNWAAAMGANIDFCLSCDFDGGKMKKIKKKKYSLRLDERVLRNSKSYASQRDWHMGTLVINALKSLYSQLDGDPQNDQDKKNEWKKYLPDGWSIKRKRKSTSVEFPLMENRFIDKITNDRSYSFEAVVEIALWNYVPSLRKYVKKALKPTTCLYKCTKCFREEEHEVDNEKKVKCKYCKGKALPKNNTKGSYYNWMLINLLEFIQYGSAKLPIISDNKIEIDISDIDPEIMKRFFVKKIKNAKKEIEASEKIPKGTHFTPLIQDVFPKWSKDNKAIVSFEGDGVYAGLVYLVRKGKVYIDYGENEEDLDKFSIKSKRTEQGGIILGWVFR